MKVLVCGGRGFNDGAFINRILNEQHHVIAFTHLIHGAASGADSLSGAWARKNGVQEVSCPAQWDFFGKGAGHIRNKRMRELDPTLLIAFPGGRGTENMIEQCTRANVQVYRPAYPHVGGAQVITPENRTQMVQWVRELLGPTKAVLWWQTSNPLLGGLKPYHMTLINREETLYRFIKDRYEVNDTLGDV